MDIFCDFIQVLVFTTYYHLNVQCKLRFTKEICKLGIQNDTGIIPIPVPVLSFLYLCCQSSLTISLRTPFSKELLSTESERVLGQSMAVYHNTGNLYRL